MEDGNAPAVEAALRRAVLDGDETAWRALHDRAFGPAWAFALRRADGDPTRAEDALQEALAIAVRRLRRFDPARGPFAAWVCGIAANVLRNEGRRERRERAAIRTMPAREPSGAGAFELGEQIAMAMACLPEAYREVLREKYEERRTVAEIADRLRRSAKAVESLLSRARSAFRDAYRRIDGAGRSEA